MKVSGIFISDINGNLVEVTDTLKALEQCQAAVLFHEKAKADYEKDNTIYYFEDAHKDWQHKLTQLEKLKVKRPDLFR